MTDPSFRSFASRRATAYVGDIAVINITSGEARAYRSLIPTDPLSNERPRLVAIALPAEVSTAIAGYKQLKAAFEAHRHAIGLAGMAQEMATGNGLSNDQLVRNILAHSEANGCGTPSGTWSYPVIPNFPFKSACDAHDICYTTNRSKASCDQEFLFNMQNLILPQVLDGWWTTTTGKALLAALLANQAKIYYTAVTQLPAATDAYCAATRNATAAECAPDAPLPGGEFGGYDPLEFPGTDDVYWIRQICELWNFPDGEGGRYFMHRNCTTYWP